VGIEKHNKIMDKLVYLTNSGEYQKAIDLLDQELTIDPKNALIWWAKGKTISMSVVGATAGRNILTSENLPADHESKLAWFHNALRCFDKALEINPDLDVVYESKSLTLSRMGKKKEAIECGLRGIEINPNNFVVLGNLVEWYNYLQDFDNGLKYANKILSQKSLISKILSKDHLAGVYFNKANSQFYLNDPDFKNSMTLAIQTTTSYYEKQRFKEHMKKMASFFQNPYE
jgi:tetratricopeptide (TPR) repeat protein